MFDMDIANKQRKVIALKQSVAKHFTTGAFNQVPLRTNLTLYTFFTYEKKQHSSWLSPTNYPSILLAKEYTQTIMALPTKMRRYS